MEHRPVRAPPPAKVGPVRVPPPVRPRPPATAPSPVVYFIARLAEMVKAGKALDPLLEQVVHELKQRVQDNLWP
eukprot:8251350-Alexandrium_andersonii.AAC.1